MTRIITRTVGAAWAIFALLALVPSAASANPAPHPTPNHETYTQIISCMKKRMAANQLLSYNQAAKDCKARVLLRGNAPSGPLVAADGAGGKDH